MLYIGVLEVELYLPEARSLKDRRRVARSLKDRAVNRYHVAAAEVGDADRSRRLTLAFTTVAGSHSTVQQTLDTLERLAYAAEAEVVEIRRALRSAGDLWG
jgi:uncharacterized protein